MTVAYAFDSFIYASRLSLVFAFFAYISTFCFKLLPYLHSSLLYDDSPFFYAYDFLQTFMTGRNGIQINPHMNENIFENALCNMFGIGFALPMIDALFSTSGVTASTTLLLMSFWVRSFILFSFFSEFFAIISDEVSCAEC